MARDWVEERKVKEKFNILLSCLEKLVVWLENEGDSKYFNAGIHLKFNF